MRARQKNIKHSLQFAVAWGIACIVFQESTELMADRPYKNTHCVPCEGGTRPLNEQEIADLMVDFKQWSLVKDPMRIERTYTFETFMRAISCVNTIARIAEQEGHHPVLTISYKQVTIQLHTFAIKGLSINDFIIASLIDDALEEHKNIPYADNDAITTVQELKNMAYTMVKEREWDAFHSPKNLAASISIEAGELLEHFVWIDSNQDAYKQLEREKTAISHELSDIFLGILLFARHNNMDLSSIFKEKLTLIKKRYPVEKAKGSSAKYTKYQ